MIAYKPIQTLHISTAWAQHSTVTIFFASKRMKDQMKETKKYIVGSRRQKGPSSDVCEMQEMQGIQKRAIQIIKGAGVTYLARKED